MLATARVPFIDVVLPVHGRLRRPVRFGFGSSTAVRGFKAHGRGEDALWIIRGGIDGNGGPPGKWSVMGLMGLMTGCGLLPLALPVSIASYLIVNR